MPTTVPSGLPPAQYPCWAVLGCLSHSPVALPGVPHVGVVDVVLVCLLIQEIKHVLDGQGEGTATVGSAEDGLKEVIHEFLQGALVGEGRNERRT